MLGARSSPFVSRITVLLVIWAELVCFSASQTTTCTMPSVEKGQPTLLTCTFGLNLRDKDQHRDVIIRRQRTTGEMEGLLNCSWDKITEDYRCKVKHPRFYFNDHITDKISLLLRNATKEDEGKYIGDVKGRESSLCNFSLGESLTKSEEGQTEVLTCNLRSSMQKGNKPEDVIVKRLKKITDKPEELLECYWETEAEDYRCKVKNPSFYFNDDISENITLLLPLSEEADEKVYYCDVTGQESRRCKRTPRTQTTCTMPSVEEGQTAEFTCFLPSTLESELPSDVLIRRNTGRTDDPEEIGECDKQNGAFTCKQKLQDKAFISYTNTQVNLFLLNGKKEDAGEYYCETPGATHVPCKFTIRERCNMPSVEEGATAVFSCYHSGAEDVSIKRELHNPSEREEIGKCVRTNGNSEMQCESKNDRVAVRFNSTQITVSLEHVKKKDEGAYFCETTRTTSSPCQLTVIEIIPLNIVAIVLGVVLSLVVSAAVAGGGLYYWNKRRGEASDHDVNNAKKGGVWRGLLSRFSTVWRGLLSWFSTEQRQPDPEKTETSDPLREIVECRSDDEDDGCLNTPQSV